MDDRQEWLSAHIYHGRGVYNREFDAFLLDAVAPLAEACVANGSVSSFFFIRYAEGGPHVRLRLFGSLETLKREVSPTLERRLGEYFASNPTRLQLQRYWPPERAKSEFGFVPSDSIVYEPYERETARYGGPCGVRIAEDNFSGSSQVTFQLLALFKRDGYGLRLGAAFELLCTIVKAFVDDTRDAVRFAANTCRAYLDAEVGWSAVKLWQAEDDLRRFLAQDYKDLETPYPVRAMYQGMEARFREDQEYYVALVTEAWDRAAARDPTRAGPLNRWTSLCDETIDALKACSREQKLGVGNFRPLSDAEQLRAIAASLLHMMNNRLGLHLREEAWLCFLLYRVLGDVGADDD